MEGRRLLGYELRDNEGAPETLLPWEIVRIIGLTEDGVTPISPIKACAQAIQLSLAGEDFTARFFENDARPRGVLEVEGSAAIDRDPGGGHEERKEPAGRLAIPGKKSRPGGRRSQARRSKRGNYNFIIL